MALPKEFQIFLRERSIKQTQVFVKWLFPRVKAAQNLSYYQAYIVKRIAFSEVKRMSISAYTRYGKSQTVAIAVAIYIMINEGKKVKFIGPTDDQAGIIKDYMSELLLGSKDNILLNMAELTAKGPARIKAEASQKRMTFTNGCEYRVVTAHGKGFAGMGHGGDLIIMDEAALISRESYAKITRMLGDDPENAALIELFNPWDRDTKAFDHSISQRFERIRIDYRIGLQEGRTTEDFIEEQREDITPLEFQVLYESRFPDESEDALHSLENIENSENTEFGFIDKVKRIISKLKDKNIRENEYKRLKDELNRFKFILSCDPADKGLDYTVIMWGISKDDTKYEIMGIYSEAKSDPMQVVAKIMSIIKKHSIGIKTEIKIDEIGIGTGPLSRIREIRDELRLKDIKITGCHYGEKAMQSTEFLNKKAENNFRLRHLFSQNAIALKKISNTENYLKLKSELLKIKWIMTSAQKKKIKDPDKSPDYSDALVYFCWRGKKLTFDFI